MSHTIKIRNLLQLLFNRRSLSTSELCTFTRKFASIMPPSAGGSIDSISSQIEDKRILKAFSLIPADIKTGKTFSQAIQKHEKLFGNIFCAMIAQGEVTGNFGTAFSKLSDYYEKKEAFQNKITRLLKYPFIILLGTTGCFATLLLFFIPLGLKKASINFDNMSRTAKMFVEGVAICQRHSSEIAILAGIILILLSLLWQSNANSPWLSSLAWKIPIAGNIVRKSSLQRFSLVLSTLLSSGFETAHALTISARELRNVFFEKRILDALVENINDTRPVFCILKELSIFPLTIIEMANDEKKQNQGNDPLKKIVTFYQYEVEAAFNALAIIIGPVFVSIIGFLGLGIIIALFQPVFFN